MTEPTPHADGECSSREALAQFHRVMRMLTGKWKAEIMWHLVERKHRFNELRRAIPGITQHVLSTRLRELEVDGLVKRTVHPEVPPRVEYEVTPSAHALKPAFDELFRWSEQHAVAAHEGDTAPALEMPRANDARAFSAEVAAGLPSVDDGSAQKRRQPKGI